MVQFSKSPPWWRTDTYDRDEVNVFPRVLHGMRGVATVRVNPNGSTQEGWGLTGPKKPDGTRGEGFIPRYYRDEFNQRITDWRWKNQRAPFAYVMRSLNVVCIDIDGKNGGFSSAVSLGQLPKTLAETSRSGNGYHLFYLTPDTWDNNRGYAMWDDQIGLAPGIDIRATGCVYHYSTQRWNHEELVAVPDYLADLLTKKRERRLAIISNNEKIKEMDEVDTMVKHHELFEELAKPIPAGKRNNTLFAIGSQMKEAAVPDWEDAIAARARQVGLDDAEADKLVHNISAYGA